MTAKTPIATISTHETQSKFKKIIHPYCKMRIIVVELIRSIQLRYHETTASWNFFIFLIAIIPPELRRGLSASKK